LIVNYKAYLKSIDLKDKFLKIHLIKMKKKFCKNYFYKRMVDGLKINLKYYNQDKQLIATMLLDEKKCHNPNIALNSFN
jgi:hypothetical protein